MTEFQGHCYEFVNVDSPIPWDQAASKCEEKGSGYKLSSIHSERESAFIYSMLSQLDPSVQGTEMWIGTNDRDDRGEEGTWKNSDDTPFDYTHWAWGEPNGSPEVLVISKILMK